MNWMRLALLLILGLTASAQGRIPVIIDTDLGDSIDDALALAFALHSPELDVRAVTTVIDDVESKTRLTWKLLGIFNRRDIPVAMGATEPLLDPLMTTSSKDYEVLTRTDTIPDSARRRAVDLVAKSARRREASADRHGLRHQLPGGRLPSDARPRPDFL